MSKDSATISLTINGEEQQLIVPRNHSLLDVLRDKGYASVKRGCNVGDCGICTVLFDGHPMRSCLMRAVDAEGHKIVTLEGLSDGCRLHPIQQAFAETGGFQCGFCSPGMILTAKALLDRSPDPSGDEIREA